MYAHVGSQKFVLPIQQCRKEREGISGLCHPIGSQVFIPCLGQTGNQFGVLVGLEKFRLRISQPKQEGVTEKPILKDTRFANS